MTRDERKERNRRWLVGLGVVIVLSSLISNGLLEYQSNRSQNNHHAATVKADNEILSLVSTDERLSIEIKNAQSEHSGTLNEIASLQKEVASVIDALPAADKYLGELAQNLLANVNALCAETHAACTVFVPTKGSP